jgi:hypothetical protein
MNDMTQTRLTEATITLTDEERQRCEIWTRVMGYHRPVSSFTLGKKGEFHERQFFEERAIYHPARSAGTPPRRKRGKSASPLSEGEVVARTARFSSPSEGAVVAK